MLTASIVLYNTTRAQIDAIIQRVCCSSCVQENISLLLDNIDSFSRAVDDAQCNKEQKIKSLQAHIKKDFSEEKMFSEYEKLYQKL